MLSWDRARGEISGPLQLVRAKGILSNSKVDAGLDLLLFGTCHPILIKKQTNIYIYIHIKHSTINHGFTYRIYTSPPSFRHGPSSSQVSWLCRWWKWPQPGLAPEPLSVWAKRWRAMEELSLWWFRLENGLRNGLRTGKSVFLYTHMFFWNRTCSTAMLNNQRVTCKEFPYNGGISLFI